MLKSWNIKIDQCLCINELRALPHVYQKNILDWSTKRFLEEQSQSNMYYTNFLSCVQSTMSIQSLYEAIKSKPRRKHVH